MEQNFCDIMSPTRCNDVLEEPRPPNVKRTRSLQNQFDVLYDKCVSCALTNESIVPNTTTTGKRMTGVVWEHRTRMLSTLNRSLTPKTGFRTTKVPNVASGTPSQEQNYWTLVVLVVARNIAKHINSAQLKRAMSTFHTNDVFITRMKETGKSSWVHEHIVEQHDTHHTDVCADSQSEGMLEVKPNGFHPIDEIHELTWEFAYAILIDIVAEKDREALNSVSYFGPEAFMGTPKAYKTTLHV